MFFAKPMSCLGSPVGFTNAYYATAGPLMSRGYLHGGCQRVIQVVETLVEYLFHDKPAEQQKLPRKALEQRLPQSATVGARA